MQRKKYPDRYRRVFLRIWAKKLDIDKVSRQLGVESWYNKPSGRKGTFPTWGVGARTTRKASLQAQLKDIVAQMKPRKRVLSRILRHAQGDLTIAVAPNEDLEHVEYILPADLIQELVSLGFEIRLSFYRTPFNKSPG
jgi:hypothetical protein